MRSGASLVPQLPLNRKQGDRAVAVFKKLRLADVTGTPTMGEAGGEWFFDIVRALFGSLDSKTKQRMVRELFLLVPKKNAKTTQGALLMLTALLLNERPRAPMIMTAPVHDVAELAFTAAHGAIWLDPVLSKLFHVREHLKTIIHRETKAQLQIMTFDPAVLTGQKVVAALVDELHIVSRMSKANSAVRQLRGGMLPYPEAFLAFITTQSEEAPAGVFRQELLKARGIRDGKRDGAMLPVLYEMPEHMQQDPQAWRDPANWTMVTPNSGRSVFVDRLREEFKSAEDTGEGELRAWASQHLNVEIGLALHSDRWAGADYWEARGNPALTLEALLARSDIVVVGGDGGGLDDLLGIAVLGRDADSGRWLLWTHAWAHKIVLERRKEIAPKLRDLAKLGELTFVDAPGEDVAQFAAIAERCQQRGLLPAKNAIGVDPYGVGDIVDSMLNPAGRFEPQQITGVTQGWKLQAAIKTTERKLAGDELEHCAQTLMAWCAGNAKVEPKGNAMLITKQASGTAKIDPLMATFNAVALMAMNPSPAASYVVGRAVAL